jgi:hypothetical protein
VIQPAGFTSAVNWNTGTGKKRCATQSEVQSPGHAAYLWFWNDCPAIARSKTLASVLIRAAFEIRNLEWEHVADHMSRRLESLII